MAVAEATVTPVVSGLVGTNLLALNLNGSGLSPLMSAIGTELRLNLLGFQGLLASNAQVDLLELGVELGVFGTGDQLDMARLLNTEVTAARLLDAALSVAGPEAPVIAIPSNGPADTVDFCSVKYCLRTPVGIPNLLAHRFDWVIWRSPPALLQQAGWGAMVFDLIWAIP